jgi:hypothetical protein
MDNYDILVAGLRKAFLSGKSIIFYKIFLLFLTEDASFPEILFIYYTVMIPAPLRRLWGKPGSNLGLLRGSLISALTTELPHPQIISYSQNC